MTVNQTYRNCLTGALQFWGRCYLAVGQWIVRRQPEAAGQAQKEPASESASLKKAAYGLLFTFGALGAAIGGFPLTRLAAGAVFPDPEPMDWQLFGWYIQFDPPTAFAIVLSIAIALAGIIWLDTEVFVAKEQARHLRQAGGLLGTCLVSGAAFLASYRTWVYNGYRYDWNIVGIGFLTLMIESALFITASQGFRLCTYPLVQRSIDWAEQNWWGVRIVGRFLAGIVAFAALFVPTATTAMLYAALALPYLARCFMAALGRLRANYRQAQEEYRQRAPERARLKGEEAVAQEKAREDREIARLQANEMIQKAKKRLRQQDLPEGR